MTTVRYIVLPHGEGLPAPTTGASKPQGSIFRRPWQMAIR